MIFDQDITADNYDEGDDDLDQQLTSLLIRQNSKFNKQKIGSTQGNSLKLQVKTSELNFQQQPAFSKQIFMPRQFQKAKRTLNKIVHDYFNQLKHQYERNIDIIQKSDMNQKLKKNAITFYLRKNKIKNIQESIQQFIGINHKYKSILDLKFNYLQQQQKRLNFQHRRGSFLYMPEVQKIINLTLKGQVNQIRMTSETKNFKFPDYATPVPFKEGIYFLDCAILDRKQKVYVADNFSYKVNDKGETVRLTGQAQRSRIKCALTRDQNFIYILGGMTGANKVVSDTCEKFCPKSEEFSSLAPLNIRHRCPSSCMVKSQIWIFSQNGIEYLDKSQTKWTLVKTPFNARFYPFQFVAPYSQNQILILGGQKDTNNAAQLKIYNIQRNWIDTFFDILPLPINSQKSWSPSCVDSGIAVLSTIQAQNQPDLKQKNNSTQVTYLTSNGIFLNNLTAGK